MRDDGATDETLAAPSSTNPKLAHGTTRGSDPTVSANVAQETRAASPSLSQTVVAGHDSLPVVDRANYQILRELARGGMGRILEARDLRLDRPIAIKEVLHDDAGARARFDREVRITAGLQHPAIVHVTEAGQWPDGQPFFAMKLIRGKPLDVRIAEATSLADRLSLLPAVIAVTDALAYAHTKSVIHRDLKPANVLVGDFGETVVIDWGIAKDLSETEELVSLTQAVVPPTTYRLAANSGGAETVEGSVMGTPSYMPPEQANGDRVDARADVYALGAMLYQVLAGVPPFIGRTTEEVLAKVLDGAPAPLATIVPDAPIDLIAVVEKAMARAPADRFPTANEMVAELKRYQQGMLVKSHDYTTWQLTKRWVHRNRGAVIVGSVAFLALVAFSGFGLWRILVERRHTEVEAIEKRTQADARTIAEAKQVMATDPTEALAILKRLSPNTSQLRAARMIASEAAAAGVAHVMTAAGQIQGLAFSPDGHWLASFEHRPTGDPGDTVRIWDLTTWTGRPIGGAPELIALGFTGDAVHAVDRQGRIWEWPATALTPVTPRLVRSIGGEWQLAQWSPDGTRVVVFSHIRQGEPAEDLVRVVDLKTDDRLVGPYRQPTWTADGRAILVHDRRANVVLRFDLATGEQTTVFENAPSPNFASDGGKHTWVARDTKSFATGAQEYLRHVETKMRVRIGKEMTQLATLPNGRVVGATLDQQGVPTEETLRGHDHGQFAPFDPGQTSSGDHSLIVSDGWPGSVTRLYGHSAAVDEIVVSRAGTIASGDRRGMIRVWTLPTVARDHGDNRTTSSFAVLGDGRELILTRRGPRLEVRNLLSNTTRLLSVTDVAAGIPRDPTMRTDSISRVGERLIRETMDGPDDEVVELAVAADGRHVATVDAAEHVVVWDLVANRGTLLADRVKHVAINHDGTRITTSREVVGQARRLIEEWNVATGKPSNLGEMTPTIMAYGPDDRLAIATDMATAFVFHNHKAVEYDVSEGKNYRSLAFSPDGKQLFLGADNWVISTVELSTGAIRQFHGHQGTVVTLLVDRDSKRLFSAAADHTVRVWNLESGTATVLRGHTGLVTSIVESEDNTLLTSSLDGTAWLWDLESLQSRPLRGHEDRVLVAGHLRGGQRIVVTDLAHQVAEYADNLPRDEALLRSWLAATTNVE